MRSMFIVTACLLLGTAGAAWCGRWWFRRAGDAFRCRIRACGRPSVLWPRLPRHWTRRRMWARWGGDILIVRRGPVFPRYVRLPAQVSPAGVHSVPSWDAKRCGPQPIAVELRVSDGSRVELAAADDARLAMVGLYLAAAMHDLPRAPVPRRRMWGWSA